MAPRHTYRVAGVVLLAALVALAGCNLPIGGDQPAATDTPGENGESAGYTAGGADLDGSELRADHVGRLEAAGSFTTRMNLTVDTENRTSRVDQATLVDLDGDRALETSDLDGALGTIRTQTFTTDDETFERFVFGSGNNSSVSYRHGTPPYESNGGTQPVNVTAAKLGRLAETAGDDINWTRTGVVTRGGVTVTRYEANGSENFAEFRNDTGLGGMPSLDSDVDEISATLFVDANGVVRAFEFHLASTTDGQQSSLTFVIETTDVGATTVEDPDWLDEARAQTSETNSSSS